MIEIYGDYKLWADAVKCHNIPDDVWDVFSYFAIWGELAANKTAKQRCCELAWAVMDD